MRSTMMDATGPWFAKSPRTVLTATHIHDMPPALEGFELIAEVADHEMIEVLLRDLDPTPQDERVFVGLAA